MSSESRRINANGLSEFLRPPPETWSDLDTPAPCETRPLVPAAPLRSRLVVIPTSRSLWAPLDPVPALIGADWAPLDAGLLPPGCEPPGEDGRLLDGSALDMASP